MSLLEAPPRTGAIVRVDATDKITGAAHYAFERRLPQQCYVRPVAATVACGRVAEVDAAEVLAMPGVLAVIWHENAPRLEDADAPELLLFQSDRISYVGQFVAAVVAESLEIAVDAADLLHVREERDPHDVVLRADHPGLYAPDVVNPQFPTDSVIGDVDRALADAPVTIDATYTTPAEHNHPMEPHATVATWDGDALTLFDSTQGLARTRTTLAKLFAVDPHGVRVVAQFVGGGFGSKGMPRPGVALAAMAARVVGRPVKLALTRDEMVAVGGHRTPTIQRVRLGADRDGRLLAVSHEALEQSSRLVEFAEQTTVATRHMYAAPNRRTTHRLVRLDVPSPSWMRAPGETPGMFALESALDELAYASGVDPVELRIRNEPPVDPEEGKPFSSRGLVACLREGVDRFGWTQRDPRPGVRRDGRWLTGSGVASATYPARAMPSEATAESDADGGFTVRICAVDIGTGARTMLVRAAAEALDVDEERVHLEIADTAFGEAAGAGGSMGTASWSWAVVKACRELRERLGRGERGPAHVSTKDDVDAMTDVARYSFGAHFAEVRVDVDTAEVHVTRMLGVFAVGRVLVPTMARSQLVGGMTMGLSMALHESCGFDARFGDMTHRDLGTYHIASCADVEVLEATWVDEHEGQLGPLGAKGLGEIGIVGVAAAIANAAYHATGVRCRDLPMTPGWMERAG